MAGLIRLNHLLARSGPLAAASVHRAALVRLIGTSPKATEAAAAPAATATGGSGKSTSTTNWVSYGFDFRDEAVDRSAMRASYFFSVTLCLVWGTFVWAYLPDPQLRDWSQREGHLALRAREQAGLEPISPHYVDPARIQLPSEEELQDVEIII